MAQLVKNLPSNAGDARDAGSISGSGRSPGGGNDNPLQHSCLENPMDSGAWWAIIHGVAKESDTTERLSNNNDDEGMQCLPGFFTCTEVF